MESPATSSSARGLTPEQAAERAILGNGAVGLTPRKQVKILLVDDRQDKLLALEAVLSSLGQKLVFARTGKEALRHLLTTEFAVVLMDISMPGMDGFETASLIRQRPRTEHIPIIFVTSISQSENQVYRGYSLGAVDYILAPIVPEVLRAKVSVFVELSLKTEQIKEQAEQLRRIQEAEHHKKLAETVGRLERETKRNRFFTLALDMLAIADFRGRFLQVNPSWEKCLGYTEEELRDRSGLELVHPEEQEEMARQMQRLQEGEPTTYFEGRYRCKDGSWRWLGWTAAPFVSEQLIYVFARDVTRRREAEREVQELNGKLKAKVAALTEVNTELETFNYSIAHDLRAPLRSMQGFAQILLADYGPRLGPDGADLANRIANSSQFMDRLLADLLDYSRLTSADMPRTQVDLDQVAMDILSALQNEIQTRGAVVEVGRPLGEAIGHAPTLGQIMSNLICNGLKFVAPGVTPRIRITSSRDGAFLRLEVQDNGIGIDPEYQGKIFGLFERLHTNKEYAGTGIGLALVRKGAERMGGRVGVESKPGNGSTFWVELPAP
jgi:PAS domain S-box-containing protein